jgi:hypothetical protein
VPAHVDPRPADAQPVNDRQTSLFGSPP